MILKEIIGVYVGDEGAQYLRLSKAFPWSKRLVVKDACEVKGNGISCLKKILQKRRYFPGRKIYLALPRQIFFARNIILPSMPVEDAVASVANSMAIYSHLPVEEILFDVYVNRVSKTELSLLIYYALEKDIAPFLNVFKATGHGKALQGLFPLSHGASAWAVLNGYKEKRGILLEGEDSCELALYNGQGPLKSAMRLKDSSTESGIQLKQELLSVEKLTLDHVTGFSTFENAKQFSHLPTPGENAGVAALAPCLAGFQELSVDGTPTRLKLFKPLPLVFILALVLVVSGFFLHGNAEKNRDSALLANKELQQGIKVLKKEIAPLAKSRAVLKKAESFREDVETFMAERPSLNAYINEIARVVPQDTWFAHFSYSPGKITMQGEAVEALKVVEALRGSSMFTSVKLMGSVSRASVGTERFRVDLTIEEKKGEALDKP